MLLSTQKRSSSMAFDTQQFSLKLHPLYSRPQAMPLCVQVAAEKVPSKSALSLIILGDVSGSMFIDDRLENLKNGIMYVHKVIQKLGDTVQLRLKIVTFNHKAQLIFNQTSPTEAQLQEVCHSLRAGGNTCFRTAINAAMDHVAPNEFTHIVFMTDGEDSTFCMGEMNPLWDRLRKAHNVFLHSVAICSEADFGRLSRIARMARHGTYQQIQAEGIQQLMGAAIALIYELIEAEARIEVRINGAEELLFIDPNVMLRCPGPVNLLIPAIPAEAESLEVSLVINDETIVQTLRLDGAPDDQPDPVCAAEYAAYIQAAASEQAGQMLMHDPLDDDIDAAIHLTQAAIDRINGIGAAEEATAFSLRILQDQLRRITLARTDRDTAREVSMRMASDANTARGFSIDATNSRTLSQLQHDFANL